jgi:hypothetical protein
VIYFLIFTHWIADFICQTDNMAKGKSTSNKWLGKHILAYSFVLSVFAFVAGYEKPGKYWMAFVLINGAAHFCVDYITSRQSSKMWKSGRVHDFFVVVGFDQAIHVATLIYTYDLFLN